LFCRPSIHDVRLYKLVPLYKYMLKSIKTDSIKNMINKSIPLLYIDSPPGRP